jgi:hypothetical protein
MVAASRQVRCFLVQRFAGEAQGAKLASQALLASSLCPVQRRSLWVGVKQDDVLAA